MFLSKIYRWFNNKRRQKFYQILLTRMTDLHTLSWMAYPNLPSYQYYTIRWAALRRQLVLRQVTKISLLLWIEQEMSRAASNFGADLVFNKYILKKSIKLQKLITRKGALWDIY